MKHQKLQFYLCQATKVKLCLPMNFADLLKSCSSLRNDYSSSWQISAFHTLRPSVFALLEMIAFVFMKAPASNFLLYHWSSMLTILLLDGVVRIRDGLPLNQKFQISGLMFYVLRREHSRVSSFLSYYFDIITIPRCALVDLASNVMWFWRATHVNFLENPLRYDNTWLFVMMVFLMQPGEFTFWDCLINEIFWISIWIYFLKNLSSE